MSGQYPGGFRGQFPNPNPQQQSPMMNQMPQQPQQQQQQPTQQQSQPPQIPAPAGPSSSQPPITSNPMLAIAQQHTTPKEVNIVALARLGQETVQDITSRFQEIFTTLKNIPPANRDNTKNRVQEYLRTIRLLFKRVRIIYEKCNDPNSVMEYTQPDSLILSKDMPERSCPDPQQSEEYRKALQENQELIETVKLKNRQLREIIDRTRIIIWEINTMLSMRRS